MNRTKSWFSGLVKQETIIFITRNLEHIEIIQTTKLFGFWIIKEEVREVYLPNTRQTDSEKLKVIADVYFELREIAYKLLEEEEE